MIPEIGLLDTERLFESPKRKSTMLMSWYFNGRLTEGVFLSLVGLGISPTGELKNLNPTAKFS